MNLHHPATHLPVCSGPTCALVQPTADAAQALHKLGLSASSYATFGMLFFLASLFPNGKFVPRWSGWIAGGWIIRSVLFFTVLHRIPFTYEILVLVSGLVCALVTQIYRYRYVSSPMQRQQTKWVALGGCIAAVIALSLGLAILRSRLWDIDIIINRTLVYSSLTALLALFYFGLIFSLQALFQGMFHQNNAVAIVVSTLAIFALFLPLRHRIQRVNEVDLEQLREHLLAVVQETMQPAHVSLWLRQPEQRGKRQNAGEGEVQ